MEYGLILMVVLAVAIFGALTWYTLTVLPEIKQYNQALKTCDCLAVCKGEKMVVEGFTNKNITVGGEND